MDEPTRQGGDATPVVTGKRSMWEDRRVRALATVAALIVTLYLAAIVSMLYYGMLGGSEGPRSAVDRDVMVTGSIVRSEESTPTAEQWQDHVTALIADSQFAAAERVIAEVNANPLIDQTRGAHMLFGTARLQSARGKPEEALDTFAEVMEVTDAAYQKELARPDDGFPNWAVADGRHGNYYLSALAMAGIYEELGRWDEGIEMLNVFLEANPVAAGIIADRGRLKAQAGDIAGAEADYREALQYVPDLKDALEGLREIGVDE
ncbi:MAG: tetratricopeptide repeat protein [Coriobacteriia bacterium]|nr:tetratricopeptide repeat protein [Coriobacteriia bacterium]